MPIQRIAIGTLIVWSMLMNAACSNAELITEPNDEGLNNEGTSNEWNHSQTESDDQALTNEDMEIGGLAIGQTMESVRQQLGEPSEQTIVHGIGDPLWKYETEGIELMLGNEVWGIRVYGPFTGLTPRNIGLGSTVEEIRNAYPLVEEMTLNGQESLVTKSANHKYTIAFTIEDGTAVHISFTQDLVIE